MTKKILILSLTLIAAAATAAFADETTTAPADKGYVCWARGQENFGGPAGSFTMTVVGYGATEFDATHDALQRCYASGLQMCTVDSCFKRR